MTALVMDGPVVGGPVTDDAVTRILLVEDDDDDYVLTRDLLAAIPGGSYALDWVTTVAAGLAAVGEQRHDAYLIDYRLGAESGLDLLRALQREGCRAPIILLTGQGDPSVDVAAMQAGAADYLVKGEVTAAELERALRYACAQEQHLAQRDQALAATEVALDHLRVSEQFALATLDALPEHIAILDDAGVILAVNAAWCRFAVANGAREDAVGIGQNYASVCAAAAATGEEQGGQAACGITDVLRGRAASFALEYPCHSPTERRWFTMEAAPFVGEGPGRVVVAHHTITARILAQQELERREESFRLLFRANPQPMWVYDVATLRFLEVNDAAVDHYGYTRDEFLALRISDIRAPEDVDALVTMVGADAPAGAAAREGRHRCKDGRIIDVAITRRALEFAGHAARLVVAADITARRQAEAALVQERDLLQTLMDTAPDSIYFKDAAARFVRVNRAQARLLGAATPDAVVGRTDFDYFPPDLARATYADDRQVLDSGQALVNRLEDQSAHGHGPRWILSTKMPIVRDGQITGLVGISRDITDLRAAEDALRASEERFRALSEHANDLVAILDRAGVFRYVSPSFERLLGYAPATMEGHNAFAFAHPDDAPALAPGFAAFVTEPGATMRTEGRARHVDGSWRVMEMVFHNRLDDPVIRGIIVNSHDVTARVQMQRDLEEGQQRYRSLFAHHPDAVFALGRDGALTSANAACAALSGYTVDELLTLAFSALIAPEDLERGDLHVARALAGAPQHDVAVRLRRKDGDGRAVSVTAIPIVVDGAVVGVYGIAKDMTAHNAAQQALRRQARYDSLTDLPNRALLHERIATALGDAPDASRPLALLLIDLDRFKEINDAFGHERGDALLRQAADRLRGVVRAGDTVARLSGDEFAVLLPGADATGAARVADAIRAALDAPLPVDEHLLRVGASVGIVLAPAHGRDGATLLRRADMAMDAAKRGRLGQALYEPAQDQHSPERLALSGALRDAIEQGALVLHYQPQVDLASGHVCGVEALVRWPHPERGLIPPDAFIPLAEQTGLIAPLTEWVLAEAIRQAREWQRAGLLLGASVNLSMWNLHDPALPDRVAALLHAHGLAPAWLRLELTESALMADTDRTMDVLARLAALGVHLAVDDFGSGYSSLSYLKRLPVDELKIDKGFVREMATDETDRAIVASTVGMGHALGLRVVAEGIEDQATWELLAGMGCDMAQGYYVARPLPPDALVRWLREAPWAVA